MKSLYFLITFILNFSFALPDDRNQPMNINADFASLDENSNVVIYDGNVVIMQGSLKILGDKAIVKHNEMKKLDVVVVYGNPAKYEQRPSVDKNAIYGNANQIDYIANKNLIKLIGKASVIQDGSKLTGEFISYNTTQRIITANGGNSKRGRVNTVIYTN